MGQQSKKSYAQQAKERREQLDKEKKAKESKQNKLLFGILGGVLAVILIAVVIIVAATRPKNGTDPQTTEPATTAPKMEEIDLTPIEGDLSETYTATDTATDLVRMTVSYTTKAGVKKQGDVYIRLFPDVAPITVANFKNLVGSGFYNGLTFHRIYPGFMIQGGDPKGDGTGSSGTNIKGEFSANGVENNLSHVRGVLSMARGSYSMDSASCQFFIVHSDNAKYSLDGSYAAFGYVVSGMETVDEITEIELVSKTGSIDRVATSPVSPVTIESAVFVTK